MKKLVRVLGVTGLAIACSSSTGPKQTPYLRFRHKGSIVESSVSHIVYRGSAAPSACDTVLPSGEYMDTTFSPDSLTGLVQLSPSLDTIQDTVRAYCSDSMHVKSIDIDTIVDSTGAVVRGIHLQWSQSHGGVSIVSTPGDPLGYHMQLWPDCNVTAPGDSVVIVVELKTGADTPYDPRIYGTLVVHRTC